MFAGLPLLTQDFRFQNINSSQCNNFASMFEGTGTAGFYVDMSVFDTTSATNTSCMFKNSGVKMLDMTGLSMLGVVDAHEMFSGCGLLTDIVGTDGIFKFASCINSTNMFKGDTGLPNFNASKVDKTMAFSKDTGGYITMSPEAEQLVDTRIQLKYDTKKRWDLYDPRPLKGEACFEIDEDTGRLRLKVGDGFRSYSELPYFSDVLVDGITAKFNSDEEITIPIDSETIFVGADGLIHSKVQLVDSETVFKDADGKIELHLDNKSIKVVGGVLVATSEAIDEVTIVRDADKLSVPIDGTSIYVDTDGKIKSRGSVTAGNALEYDATDPSKLNVVTDDATTGVKGGAIAVNYDGGSIYWDTSIPGMFGNGALRSVQTRAFDDTLTEKLVGHDYMLSVPIDDDTIKLVGGKIVATTQVPGVKDPIILQDSEITLAIDGALEVKNKKLTVAVDDDTIKVVGGKLVGNAKITVDSPLKIDGSNISLQTGDSLKVSGGKLETALEVAEPLKLTGNELDLNLGDSLKLENGKLETTLKVRSDGKIDISSLPIDNDTIYNKNGLLKADIPEPDLNTIREYEGKWFIPIDGSTIKMVDGVMRAPRTNVVAGDAIKVTNDGIDAKVDVKVDGDTVKVIGDELVATHQVPYIDNKTVKVDSERLYVNIDHISLEYNSDEDFVEVISNELKTENGIYMRDETNGDVVIGVHWGGEFKVTSESVTLNLGNGLVKNSEGEVEIVTKSIVGEGGIEVTEDSEKYIVKLVVDSENLAVNSEGKLSVKDMLAGEGISISNRVISANIDNETIYVDTDNKIKTYIGGGYTGTKAPVTISKGTNVAKRRNYEKTEYDEAEYVITTINFPTVEEYGNRFDAVVDGNATLFGTQVELQFNYINGNWVGYTDDGDRIVIKETETVVTCTEKFEDAPATANCEVKTREQFRDIAYVDNQFIKVDNDTVYVNSEGELAANVIHLNGGDCIEVTDSEVKLLYDPQFLQVGDDNRLFVKRHAVVDEDSSTIKRNFNGHLEVQVDRGLDIVSGKVGHIHEIVAKTVGNEITVPEITIDGYGHVGNLVGKSIPSYQGASISKSGTPGFVPAASSTERNKFLKGDGTWDNLLPSSQYEVRIVEQTATLDSAGKEYEFNMSSYIGSTAIAPLNYYCRTASELASVNFMCLTASNTDKMVLFIKGNTGAKLTVACQWLCLKSGN